MSDWTFFSNYGHVLVCLARNRQVRLRDVALDVGITERAVQKIVRDLQEAGFLTVTKQGRCNRYRINKRKALRHSLESHCTVGKLIALIARTPESGIVAEATTEADQSADRTPAPETRAGPEASPSPDVSSEPASPATEMKKDKDRKEKIAPVDKRQQGSLF